MSITAGIWIDNYKAVVVLITDEGEQVLQIKSHGDTLGVLPGGARIHYSDAPNEFVPGENYVGSCQTLIDVTQYYDEVISWLNDPDTILVMGPGDAKRECIKRIANKKLKGRVVQAVTVDNMTDCEIVTHMRQLMGVISKFE